MRGRVGEHWENLDWETSLTYSRTSVNVLVAPGWCPGLACKRPLTGSVPNISILRRKRKLQNWQSPLPDTCSSQRLAGWTKLANYMHQVQEDGPSVSDALLLKSVRRPLSNWRSAAIEFFLFLTFLAWLHQENTNMKQTHETEEVLLVYRLTLVFCPRDPVKLQLPASGAINILALVS